MNDSTDREPAAGSDPTNGLAGDLEGDDGGAVEPEETDRGVLGEVIAEFDPDRPVDDESSSLTSYSEEGTP